MSARIALVGCGRWGRNILRDLKSLGCRVTVMERSESSRERALAGGADGFVRTLEELPESDGIVVATPTAAHAETILSLLARGCPIFCEKPLTSDPRTAREICARAGDRVFVMDKWRYHPGVQALRDIARGGALGAVLGIRTVRLGWGNSHGDVSIDWILLPHDLAIAHEITGRLPEPVRAFAERDGEALLALSAWLEGPYWMHCEIGARSPEHRREVELRCEKGVATLGDAYDDHVAVLRSAGCMQGGPPAVRERIPIPATMPLRAELECFVAHLAGRGPPPKASAQEGLLVVETIARIRALAGLA